MNIPPFSNMTLVTALSGSTGANMYKNTTDKKWVIKKSKKGEGGFDQVKIEAAANDIYQALGVPVPRHILDVANKALILEYIDGKTLNLATKDEKQKAKTELQKGFIVDALLANWDVIGLVQDNIIVPSDGSPAVRIDNGGSLTFKATGGKKPLNKVVTELDTMRNKTLSPQAAAYFGDLSDTEIDTQIKTIIVPNYDRILSLTPEELKEIIKARLDNLIERTVWTNASAFKNTVKETSEPQYIQQVQTALIKYFKDGWLKNFKNINKGSANNSDERLLEFINTILKENEAVISGGFILKAIGSFVDEKSVDMDMYVPEAHAENFRKIMTKLFDSESVVKHVVSNAPGSFFKKNGILSVSKYSKSKPKYAEMDIVEVNSDRTPEDVVKNFDLTFCENWYNGETVYMTHPDHVKTKHGFLENHYLNILFTGNPVLINRMKKYIGRGFRVSINNPVTKKPDDITDGIMKGELFQQQIKSLGKSIPVSKPVGSYGVYSRKSDKKVQSNKSPLNIANMPLDQISDHIDEFPENNSTTITKNMKYNESLNSSYVLMAPFSLSILSSVDIECIKYYTGTGFSVLNNFLYSDKNYRIADKILHAWLTTKFPKNTNEPSEKYGKRLLYYYFVNLYNAVQKGPRILTQPFVLYRGTKTWYLHEDPNRLYYINSFTSTTVKYAIAKTFGTHHKFKDNRQKKLNTTSYIYVFYVHPMCKYMNVKQLSNIKSEDEILLTPYHRYYYIGEAIKGDIIEKKFIVLPTDLSIPQTFDTFIPWKDNNAKMDKDLTNEENKNKNVEYKGGRAETITTIKQTLPFYNMNQTAITSSRNAKMTAKNLKTNMQLINNTRKLNNTRKVNKMNTVVTESKGNENNKEIEIENIKRFTEPIQSFPGKAPIAAEMDLIKKMSKFFEKDTQ